MPRTNPHIEATRLSVASGSEACSSSIAAPHEFFDQAGRLYHADTLDDVWPLEKPFGKFSWETDEARPNDVKMIQ
jgi:hypothetical protein